MHGEIRLHLRIQLVQGLAQPRGAAAAAAHVRPPQLEDLALEDTDDLRRLQLPALGLVPRQLDAEPPGCVEPVQLDRAAHDLERHLLAPTVSDITQGELHHAADSVPLRSLRLLVVRAKCGVSEERHVPRHALGTRDATALQQGAIPLREAHALQPRLVEAPDEAHGHGSAASLRLQRRGPGGSDLILKHLPLRLRRADDLLHEL
mmetsp:Transcript_22506/g.64767  ORF Transcript_22506/g.64767 Transcript_22506/m.64767 type:complete len:205 (+) Transcript_22506:626-1240(+)